MNAEQERQDMQRSKQQVAFDLKDLLASIEALLRATSAYTGAEIEGARTRLEEQRDLAQQYLNDWGDAALKQYRQTVSRVDEYAHDRPWQLAGIAALAGMIAGHCLLGRSGRD